MAMNLLVTRYMPPVDPGSKVGSFTVRVHLDTTKTVVVNGQPAPDPAYVFERTYPVPVQQPSETKPQFRARLNAWWASTKPEFKTDARYTLDRLADEIVMADEGTTL